MKAISRIFYVCWILAVSCLSMSASSGPADLPPTPAGSALAADTDENCHIAAEAVHGHSMPVTIYSQGDPSWGDFLYGGRDPMASYGCGPTALAIAVTSLTDQEVTPVDAARWSYANGYFSPGRGSVHGLIPRGAESYGLRAEKLTPLTPDSFRMSLSADKLLVLLMGPGDFTDSGHFIIAYGYDDSGRILIADPASAEHSSTAWAAETLISQLSNYAKDGGPVWALSKL